MTYTLYLNLPRHLTWDDIREADSTIASGMLEEVLPYTGSLCIGKFVVGIQL